MAAQLAEDKALEVRRQRGGLGELRIVVDGIDVVETKPLWYPTPSSVVDRVRAYLRGSAPPI